MGFVFLRKNSLFGKKVFDAELGCVYNALLLTEGFPSGQRDQSQPTRWFVPVRNCSIAAAILLLFIFTFQMITVNYATDGASIIAYQNETLSKTRPIKDGDLYINYIQNKLYGKSSYELLKKKIYESKY